MGRHARRGAVRVAARGAASAMGERARSPERRAGSAERGKGKERAPSPRRSRSRSPNRRRSRSRSASPGGSGDERGRSSRRDGGRRSSRKEHKRHKEHREDREHRRRHRSSSSRHRRERDRDGRKSSRRRRSRSSSRSRSPSPAPKDAKLDAAAYAERRARKLARTLRVDSIAGYTNEDNPFGDANLTERFVWRKKITADVNAGKDISDELTLDAERRRHEARLEEIEKVKRRREDRAREQAEHDAEMEQLNRERAMLEFAGWEQKEDEFHAQQARVRSEIRIAEGRAKPFDVLTKQLAAGLDYDFNLKPIDIMEDLTEREIQDLQADVRGQLALMDGAGQAQGIEHEFWLAMLPVVEEKLRTHRAEMTRNKTRRWGRDQEENVEAANRSKSGGGDDIHAEVDSLLAGKSSAALDEMSAQIESMLTGGGAVEVEYWERVKARLGYFRAAAALDDIHEVLSSQAMEAQRRAMLEAAEKGGEGTAADGTASAAAVAVTDAEEEAAVRNAEADAAAKEAARREAFRTTRAAGSPSPEPEDESELRTLGAWPVLEPEEDLQQLRQLRRARARGIKGKGAALQGSVVEEQAAQAAAVVSAAAAAGEGAGGSGAQGRTDMEEAEGALVATRFTQAAVQDREAAERAFRAEAEKEMGTRGDTDGNFRQEVGVDSGLGGWAHDRFRPRKPMYFNRVTTSYQWHQYNRTHYDFDNPPPKSVTGYKFNIFYPDLIDKSKPPTYSFLPDPASPEGETVLIKFHAGPPYEDIAFRVVNGPIAHGQKRGERNTFERGVLRVWYNLAFLRYRR